MKPIEAAGTLAALFGKDLLPETVAGYAAALSDIEPELLAETVRQCVATCRFFPFVAEVRSVAARLAGVAAPSSAEILAIVRRASSVDFEWHPAGSICRHSWNWPAGLEDSTLEICKSLVQKSGSPVDRNGDEIFGWENDLRKSYEAEMPSIERRLLLNLSSARLLEAHQARRLTP